MNAMRIDKWLWCVRLFKTRTLAGDACKSGNISINGIPTKPSKMVEIGDEILVRKSQIDYTFRILSLTPNRLNAKLVPQFMENITTPEQLEQAELLRIARQGNRVRGAGRPTKRERRKIDQFFTPFDTDEG